jgi:UDP-glucose 4-epimerase
VQNVLLLGGSGFLGKNIAGELLSHNDFSITVFDMVNNFYIPIRNRINFYQGNLTDTDNIIDIIEDKHITAIIHCISILLPASDTDQYIKDSMQVMLPTIKILDYCAANNIKFIFFSSGGTIYGNNSHAILSEEAPPAPISFYGLSKLQMEETICFYHRRYGMNYLILRPSNPFGYGQNLYGQQGLIAVLFGKLFNNKAATIYGDGSSLRDYIYIKDFTHYIVQLLKKNIINTTINIGSGQGYSISQIISFIEKVSGKKISVIHEKSRKNDVADVILDISKLNALIPHDQLSIEKGIADFYNQITSEYF